MNRVNLFQAAVLVLLVAILASLVVVVWPEREPRYDYTIVSVPDLTLEHALDKLGGMGWEVVSARRAAGGGTASYELLIRRRLRGAEKPRGPFSPSEIIDLDELIIPTGAAP